MIKIKVKTLNGTDTSFEVSENLTIKEFKEHVATSINIPAPNQRIIYHGRVLLDDKVLSSLNLNEQTLHVVERPPGQSEQLPQNNVLPSRQPVTEISEQQIAIGNVFVSVTDMEQDAIIDSMHRLVERLSDGEGRPTMRVSRQTPDRNLEILLIMQETEIDSPAYARLRHIENCLVKIEQALHHLEDRPVSVTESMSDRRTMSVSSEGSSSAMHFEEPRRNGESSHEERSPRVNIREASPAYFASVFERVQATQRRLEPFLAWYFNILQNEPTYSAESQQQAQRDTERFERFQSIMHHMGHVYHCLSDLYVPFATQAPPRIVEPRANRIPTTRIRPPELHIIMQFVRANDEPPLTPQSAPAISTAGGFTMAPMPATFSTPNPFFNNFRLGGVPTTTVAAVGRAAAAGGTGGFRAPGAAAAPTTTANAPAPFLGGLRLGGAPLVFGATALRTPSSGAGATRPPASRPAAFWPLGAGGFMDAILGRQTAATTATSGVRPVTSNQPATEQARTARIPTQFTAGSTNSDIPPFLQSFINHFTSALANGADQAEHGDGDGLGAPGGQIFISGETMPISAMHAMGGEGTGPGATTTASSLHGGASLGAGRLVDSFLPCSSRHFAQQPPPEMLSARRRRRQNADLAASQTPSSERAPEVMDAQEFEDAMESALRSVIHNLRAQRSSPASAITVHTVTGSFPADELHQHSSGPQRAATTDNSASRATDISSNIQMNEPAAHSFTSSTPEQATGATNMDHEQPDSSHTSTASGANRNSSSVRPKFEASPSRLQDGWKSQVPRDWVPIIEADIERQREEPAANLTFSDAYTNGMSSKRKRMVTELATPELPVKCVELEGRRTSTKDAVEGDSPLAEGVSAMSSASSSSRGFLHSPPEKRFSGETAKNGPADVEDGISSEKEEDCDGDIAKKLAKN